MQQQDSQGRRNIAVPSSLLAPALLGLPPHMAWTPTLLGLPLLLLPLLPLFWASTRAGDRKVVLLAPPEVRGSPGDTVNLTCVLQPVESEIPQVKQIRWEKLDSWGYLSTVAEFDWDQGPNITEPNRVQFISAGKDPDVLDASLTLTELHPDDDANYTCEVTTFLQGSGRASTWVRVFYAPQVSISLYEDFGPQGHRETSLSCDARGNPEPRNYEWSTTMGLLPPSAVPQGSWLLLQPSEESINVTFICRVSNNLGSAQATIKVLLPECFCCQRSPHAYNLEPLLVNGPASPEERPASQVNSPRTQH